MRYRVCTSLTRKITDVCRVMPWRPASRCQCISNVSSTLMIETEGYFETSVKIYQTTRRHIPEGNIGTVLNLIPSVTSVVMWRQLSFRSNLLPLWMTLTMKEIHSTQTLTPIHQTKRRRLLGESNPNFRRRRSVESEFNIMLPCISPQ
jgi:hypothetical protein